jgi:hypothetical protein
VTGTDTDTKLDFYTVRIELEFSFSN